MNPVYKADGPAPAAHGPAMGHAGGGEQPPPRQDNPMTTTLPPAPDAPALVPAADDAEAVIQRECRHVAAETVPGLRMAALIAAGLNLGKEGGVPLETAAAALVAAARAGNYPAEIEGEDVASIIRRWLWTGRRQVPGWDRARY